MTEEPYVCEECEREYPDELDGSSSDSGEWYCYKCLDNYYREALAYYRPRLLAEWERNWEKRNGRKEA